MRVVLGCDGYGYELKEAVRDFLEERGLAVLDLSPRKDQRPYYETAQEAAGRVASGQAERAVLVCGTGMGMAIMANKREGVYAAVCENAEAARKSRSINNSNVLALGGMVTSPETMREIVAAWLDTGFTQDWPAEVQGWLESSMQAIASLERERFRSA